MWKKHNVKQNKDFYKITIDLLPPSGFIASVWVDALVDVPQQHSNLQTSEASLRTEWTLV